MTTNHSSTNCHSPQATHLRLSSSQRSPGCTYCTNQPSLMWSLARRPRGYLLLFLSPFRGLFTTCWTKCTIPSVPFSSQIDIYIAFIAGASRYERIDSLPFNESLMISVGKAGPPDKADKDSCTSDRNGKETKRTDWMERAPFSCTRVYRNFRSARDGAARLCMGRALGKAGQAQGSIVHILTKNPFDCVGTIQYNTILHNTPKSHTTSPPLLRPS